MPAPIRRLLLLVALLTAPAASAQMLPSGTWTGTLDDGDDQHAVTAEIAQCTGGFTLELDVDGRTAEVPEDDPATWERGRLRFETSRLRLPGALLPRPLTCDLEADDVGALAGTCTSGRRALRLRLAPPADGQLGCE